MPKPETTLLSPSEIAKIVHSCARNVRFWCSRHGHRFGAKRVRIGNRSSWMIPNTAKAHEWCRQRPVGRPSRKIGQSAF